MLFRTLSSRFLTSLAAAVFVVAGAVASAALTSGPQPGESVGAFTVTKVAGNASDGVDDGKTLCYRCRMGSRPVVMIFARSGDAQLAKLVNELEDEIKEHEDAKLSSFVNMIGGETDTLKQTAAKFVSDNNVQNVAFVVPEDAENGPENLKIAPTADLTVVCYKNGKVVSSHAFEKGGLNDDTIAAVVEASCNLVD